MLTSFVSNSVCGLEYITAVLRILRKLSAVLTDTLIESAENTPNWNVLTPIPDNRRIAHLLLRMRRKNENYENQASKFLPTTDLIVNNKFF